MTLTCTDTLYRMSGFRNTKSAQYSSKRKKNTQTCCGSGSGFNGVPGSVSWSGFAIRIRIQEGKMAQKKREQLINFIFWSAGCSFFQGWRLPLYGNLDVLTGDIRISKLQFMIKKRKEKNFSCFFFLQFLAIKPWIRIRIRIYLKCWIRIQLIRIHKLRGYPYHTRTIWQTATCGTA